MRDEPLVPDIKPNITPLMKAMIESLGRFNVALNKAKPHDMDRYRSIRSKLEDIDRELQLWSASL